MIPDSLIQSSLIFGKFGIYFIFYFLILQSSHFFFIFIMIFLPFFLQHCHWHYCATKFHRIAMPFSCSKKYALPASQIIEMLHIPIPTPHKTQLRNKILRARRYWHREDYSSADDSDIDYPDSYYSHNMSENNVEGNGDSYDDIEYGQGS